MHRRHQKKQNPQSSVAVDVLDHNDHYKFLSSRFSLAVVVVTITIATTIAIVTRKNNTTSPLILASTAPVVEDELNTPTDPIVVYALYIIGSTELITMSCLFGLHILKLNEVQADYFAGVMFLVCVVFFFVYIYGQKENFTPRFVTFVQLYASLGLLALLGNAAVVFFRHRNKQLTNSRRIAREVKKVVVAPSIGTVVPEGTRAALRRTESQIRKKGKQIKEKVVPGVSRLFARDEEDENEEEQEEQEEQEKQNKGKPRKRDLFQI